MTSEEYHKLDPKKKEALFHKAVKLANSEQKAVVEEYKKKLREGK